MTRTLILTRHAKSDWGNPMQADQDRPLNKRGAHDAPRIGAWLLAEGHIPDEALVSSAQRTRETWALLSAAFERDMRVQYVDRLYHAGAATILQTLQGARAELVILIGHNPGIADAAHRLLMHAPAHRRFMDYPTCATLVCQFDVQDWSEVDWGSGRTIAFLTPHDLNGVG